MNHTAKRKQLPSPARVHIWQTTMPHHSTMVTKYVFANHLLQQKCLTANCCITNSSRACTSCFLKLIFLPGDHSCAKRCSVVQITKSLDHYIVTSLKHEIIVKMSHVATKRMKTGPACASCVSKIPTPNPPMEKHGSPRSLESVKSM